MSSLENRIAALEREVSTLRGFILVALAANAALLRAAPLSIPLKNVLNAIAPDLLSADLTDRQKEQAELAMRVLENYAY
jgi:hypothetical protein